MGLDLGYFPKLGRRQAQRLDFGLMETLSFELSNIRERVGGLEPRRSPVCVLGSRKLNIPLQLQGMP